ncbi:MULTISPECIES: alanine dehydrogenase [Saccharopolyspora]|uniref:Alanine dehydrogenase n=2 Tax=Saccharopolyspora TaxID=1835 RepID=A0A4R5BYM7_9PSEU|nr:MULTISPECIES: alanine dehydrogenase [Saccharopolyspora]MBQ0925519.1 alanine dehydrogenase [Saccharopolyspora endophytica]TDD89462.1 alanine dehydrogenase [Saccharopolyspora karakumensis]
MKIGVPRELKNHEYRVAATPAGVYELVSHGHEVVVERGAGVGSSIADDDYSAAGAKLLESADDVWAQAELVLKVKEPIAEEYGRMRRGQVLFTYLHLAASEPCTRALLDSGVTGVAYETVQLPDGSLPLLFPMSEVAGRLAPFVGAQSLMRVNGGRGTLMGGVSGVAPARVAVLGAGVAGMNAVAGAAGVWADVELLDKNVDKLRAADRMYQGRIRTTTSNSYEIQRAVTEADLVIGAVLVPGAKAPKLISNELVSRMKSGSVLVDISVDQGGCMEDSRPTTHDDPTFQVHDSVFYCVANMPGSVPNTSTYALTNVTLPYVVEIANRGLSDAASTRPELWGGINTVRGHLTNASVAEAFGMGCTPADQLLI